MRCAIVCLFKFKKGMPRKVHCQNYLRNNIQPLVFLYEKKTLNELEELQKKPHRTRQLVFFSFCIYRVAQKVSHYHVVKKSY